MSKICLLSAKRPALRDYPRREMLWKVDFPAEKYKKKLSVPRAQRCIYAQIPPRAWLN